ncbi:DUF2177 family protein [Desulfosoma sp.]
MARRSGDTPPPLWWAAVIVYLLIPLGILLFALPGVNPERGLLSALFWGFLFGVTLYGVYDFTNLSTLARWPVPPSFADTAWGRGAVRRGERRRVSAGAMVVMTGTGFIPNGAATGRGCFPAVFG